MTFSLFSVAIIMVFIVILAIEVYSGIQKGFQRKMISLGAALAAVIVSSVLSPLLSMPLASIVYEEVVSGLSICVQLLKKFPSSDELLKGVVGALLSTVLFVIVFFILQILVDLIVAKLLRSSQASDTKEPGYVVENGSYFDKNSKVLGGIAGGVTAVVIAMVITSPIMGSFDAANRIMVTFEKVNSKSITQAIGEQNRQAVKTYSHDVVGNILYQFGGKLMYRGAASTYMYGEKVSLFHEIEVVEKTMDHGMALYKEMKKDRSNAKTCMTLLNALSEDVEQYRMCQGVAADLFAQSTNAWRRGEKAFGMPAPDVNRLARPVVNEILSVCAQSDMESVRPNVMTLIKIMSILIDYDMLSLDPYDYDKIMKILSNGEFEDRINEALKENPYMREISVSSLAMTVVAEQLVIHEYDEEKYSLLMSDLANAVNTVQMKGYGSDDERAQALAAHAVKQLEEYGLSVDPEVAKLTATALLDELATYKGAVTQDQMREIFDRYTE